MTNGVVSIGAFGWARVHAQNALVGKKKKSMYYSMSEKIDKCDLCGQTRIFELELGKVLAYRNIPFRFVLRNQLINRSSRECLRQGAEVRECLRG